MECITDRRRVRPHKSSVRIQYRHTAFLCKTLEETNVETPELGLATSDHGWQLLVVADQNHMLRLCQETREWAMGWPRMSSRTPFINGISDAGSVAIDASSRKTTGKSMFLSSDDAAPMHVVQI